MSLSLLAIAAGHCLAAPLKLPLALLQEEVYDFPVEVKGEMT